MPIYLYKCRKCNEQREYLIKDNNVPNHCENPECGVDGIFLERKYDGQRFGLSGLDKEFGEKGWTKEAEFHEGCLSAILYSKKVNTDPSSL